MSQVSYQNLKTQLGSLKEKGAELMDEYQVRENLEQAAGKTREVITKYPIAAVAGGFLIGFVLGALLTRDND